MLRRFSAKGFRCLYDMRIDLEPLTILIGPNDSGKSSILDCLSMLSRICNGELGSAKHFSGKHDPLKNMTKSKGKKNMLLKAMYDHPSSRHEDVDYSIGLAENLERGGAQIESEVLKFGDREIWWRSAGEGQGSNIQGTKSNTGQVTTYNFRSSAFAIEPGVALEDRKVLGPLASIKAYSLRTEALARPCKSILEPEMDEKGDGLSAALESFALAERERFEAIEEALCKFSPMVKGLKIRPVGSEKDVRKVVHAVLDEGFEVAADLMSDGLLYALGYLTLINSTERPMALLVEEPENGIHPENLEMIMSFFREVSAGSVGLGPVQVVLSTHSPYLLDLAMPEEVRIVTRTKDRGTVVTTMDEVEGLKEKLGDFKLGELWTSIGDEALAQRAAK